MISLKSVLLEGFLKSDPVLAYTENGAAVCRFRVESQRACITEDDPLEEVSYFDIVAQVKLAEVCAEYTKGGHRAF